MAQIGDVIRTRYCISQWGRSVSLTFWWRLTQWHPAQRMDEFVFRNGVSWLAAVDPWIDTSYIMAGGTARNLTTPEPDVPFAFYVTGVPKVVPTDVVQAAVWVRRKGVDASGNLVGSSFPITNIQPPVDRGRLKGTGENFRIIEYLTLDHLIISPLNPRWEPGFISRVDGSFVRCNHAHINPVIKEMKKRTMVSRTILPPPIDP